MSNYTCKGKNTLTWAVNATKGVSSEKLNYYFILYNETPIYEHPS